MKLELWLALVTIVSLVAIDASRADTNDTPTHDPHRSDINRSSLSSRLIDIFTTTTAATTTGAAVTPASRQQRRNERTADQSSGVDNESEAINVALSNNDDDDDAYELVDDDADDDDGGEGNGNGDKAGDSAAGSQESSSAAAAAAADDSSKPQSKNSQDTSTALAKRRKRSEKPVQVEDYFGDLVVIDNNRTTIVHPSSARFFPLTLTALILGPIIGITIKGAIIRGLLWALGAYVLHLLFPSLLSSLGLGSGLVGFSRSQLRPDYLTLAVPLLLNLPERIGYSLPTPVRPLYWQFAQALVPLVEYIRAMPAGPCRYRAVCELSSLVAQQSRAYGKSLRRLSATIYINFGTDYSKAWLDGIVRSNCAVKYRACGESPLAAITAHLQTIVNQVQGVLR